ncbi:V-type proton ATPase subunit G 2 isoform X3 [Lemur catta]|uniref:V-type proton ATPase subunit G 2 isoform X3 n=1 Tax=Lemur catta TaxID=9447 RepID=UPI001E26CC3F|nr:V-type proton ATPase subunit G 2 isoform X3 [Lemur catta]
MASQSQGIQQLLQAEKRAAEKVADARKRKARRLKQAKEEAQMEVEQYRREREQEFQSKQQAEDITSDLCKHLKEWEKSRLNNGMGLLGPAKNVLLELTVFMECCITFKPYYLFLTLGAESRPHLPLGGFRTPS